MCVCVCVCVCARARAQKTFATELSVYIPQIQNSLKHIQ